MRKRDFRTLTMKGLFVESPLRAGEGQRDAAVDLPVSREGVTGYPYIAGSSLKGAMRDAWRADDGADDDPRKTMEVALFGPRADEPGDDGAGAGALIVADARLLLLPVRSKEGPCWWVTCPDILRRFARDRAHVGVTENAWRDLCDLTEEAQACKKQTLHLEELEIEAGGPDDIGALAETVQGLFNGNTLYAPPTDRIAVVSDAAFAWFARHAVPVRARNQLDPERKTVVKGALWYEEAVAPSTVFWIMLGARRPMTTGREKDPVKALFSQGLQHEEGQSHHYLQVGANETVGQGWVSLHRVKDTP